MASWHIKRGVRETFMNKQYIFAATSLLLFFSVQSILTVLLEIGTLTKVLILSLLVAGTVLAGLALFSILKQYRTLAAAASRDRRVLFELQTVSQETTLHAKRLCSLELAKEEIVRKQTALFDLTLDAQRTSAPFPSTDQRNNI